MKNDVARTSPTKTSGSFRSGFVAARPQLTHSLALTFEWVALDSGLALSPPSKAEGKGKKPPILLLLSGFPDSVKTFEEFSKPFENDFHVVRMAYPDMDQPGLRRFWGYNFDQVVDGMEAVVQSLDSDDIYLMGHDWGSFATMLYVMKYPTSVRKIVLEDVGMSKPSEMSLYAKIGLISYQSYMAFLFGLSRIVNNDSWTWWFFGMLVLFPWPILGPTTKVSVSSCR